jgi:hypothetical protein
LYLIGGIKIIMYTVYLKWYCGGYMHPPFSPDKGKRWEGSGTTKFK